ncbi:unnamed protein product [Rhizophagus irregularis]|nr:unnamed protein product [Rhizophagus irregularis]
MITGNRFGREIEFREGEPIQLLQYIEDNSGEEFGKIVTNPEALKILQTIREPLAIISVVGSYRRESPESFKDYFLEKLNNVNPEAAKGIKKIFVDFDVYGLPHPGCKRKMLQHMEDAVTDDLDEEFVDEVENADYWERFVKIGLTQENLFESNDEFQEALRAFELAYEKSMMKSPEAAKKFEQLHNEMVEQQKLSEEEKIRLLEQQELKFEQIQREAEERNRELRAQLSEEKEKAIEKQNEFYKRQLSEQIAANERQHNTMLELMQRDKDRDNGCVIS